MHGIVVVVVAYGEDGPLVSACSVAILREHQQGFASRDHTNDFPRPQLRPICFLFLMDVNVNRPSSNWQALSKVVILGR